MYCGLLLLTLWTRSNALAQRAAEQCLKDLSLIEHEVGRSQPDRKTDVAQPVTRPVGGNQHLLGTSRMEAVGEGD